MDLMRNNSLLALRLVAFRILWSLMHSGHFKHMIELTEFDYSKLSESTTVNTSISLMKIKAMLPGNYLQHHVVCFEIEIFLLSSIITDCWSPLSPFRGNEATHFAVVRVDSPCTKTCLWLFCCWVESCSVFSEENQDIPIFNFPAFEGCIGPMSLFERTSPRNSV
jgi:hypothetical protein